MNGQMSNGRQEEGYNLHPHLSPPGTAHLAVFQLFSVDEFSCETCVTPLLVDNSPDLVDTRGA